MKKIVIYTTNNCGYCMKAKEYFKKLGLSYEEINVSGNTAKQNEMIEKSGQYSVPVIEIGGRLTLGFDISKINELLSRP
jgi:glutaredoxin-like YruB-family protein